MGRGGKEEEEDVEREEENKREEDTGKVRSSYFLARVVIYLFVLCCLFFLFCFARPCGNLLLILRSSIHVYSFFFWVPLAYFSFLLLSPRFLLLLFFSLSLLNFCFSFVGKFVTHLGGEGENYW